eukprot:2399388-Pyramimonas_sp.AAC.1
MSAHPITRTVALAPCRALPTVPVAGPARVLAPHVLHTPHEDRGPGPTGSSGTACVPKPTEGQCRRTPSPGSWP